MGERRIDDGRHDAQHLADVLERAGEQGFPVLAGQPAGLAAMAPGLAHGLAGRGRQTAPGHRHHHQHAEIAVLAIDEGQEAQFAQRIAAIAGHHMIDVVQLAHAGAEAMHIGRDGIIVPVLGGGDQRLGRQVFGFHELQIGPADRAFGKPAQALAVLEQGEQVAFLAQHRAAGIGLREAAEIADAGAAAHGAQQDEDLFGVAGVDQGAGGAQRRQGAQARVDGEAVICLAAISLAVCACMVNPGLSRLSTILSIVRIAFADEKTSGG